jgi:hypothetical integral membrane protein (TIGR02206 family)
MPPVFHPFTLQHLAAVSIGLAVTAGLIAMGRSGHRGQQISTGILAFLNLATFGIIQVAWQTVPEMTFEQSIPAHLCDIASILSGFALLTRRRLLCELTYFWGLAATIQGLLTPALELGFPSWPFITFFFQHFAVVAAALYLPLVDGWRPERPWWRSPLRALGWSNVYLAFAMLMNWRLGTNFGFAAHKPVNPSLLDYLGPWPWYLLGMEALALLFFGLLTLPFFARKPAGN